MTGSPVGHSALLLRANARRSAYFREEHDMLRDQVRRFVEQEVKPRLRVGGARLRAAAEVLARMASSAFSASAYPAMT